jgi:peptidoglycan hydrolase-like protein with peptidoglycan-binding domain
MNKKIFWSFFAILVLIIPTVGFAQVGDIDPQGDSTCVTIVNNLRYKSTDVKTDGEVSVLQDFLQTSGYLNSNPVGFFGLMTTKAVKKFQQENNISPTGYVGPITREKIKNQTCSGVITQNPIPTPPTYIPVTPTSSSSVIISAPANLASETTNLQACTSNMPHVFTGNLKIGDYGDDVLRLKCFLNAKGFILGNYLNSYFGEMTRDALIKYQTAKGIAPADGFFGPALRAVINADGVVTVSPVPVVVPVATKYVAVIYPNGGEYFTKGETYTLNWTWSIGSQGDKASVSLISEENYQKGVVNGGIIESNAIKSIGFVSSGYQWKVPTDLPDGAYRMLVSYTRSDGPDKGVKYYYDYSDTYFKVSSKYVSTSDPYIKVVYPKAGLVVEKGSTYRISWYAPGIANLYIKLRKGSDTYHNPDSSFDSSEASIVLRVNANENHFDWKIPTTLPSGSDYSIRIIDFDGAKISADSEGYFTIK